MFFIQVVVVVRKKRVFEFDVCLCCMIVDFMSSFVVSELVAGVTEADIYIEYSVRMILN